METVQKAVPFRKWGIIGEKGIFSFVWSYKMSDFCFQFETAGVKTCVCVSIYLAILRLCMWCFVRYRGERRGLLWTVNVENRRKLWPGLRHCRGICVVVRRG